MSSFDAADATGDESAGVSVRADLAQRVRDVIEKCDGLLLVVTGAGVSLASGIATFRGTDEGAVWKNDVMEKGTYRYFRAATVDSWQWYASRFEGIADARPNPTHEALVDVEKIRRAAGRPFLVITQNVDGLHHRAGQRDLVEVHGCSRFVRCARDGCRFGAPGGRLPREQYAAEIDAFLAQPSEENLPRCPACSDVVRPHVLWFDEFYADHDDYQWDRTQEAAQTAEAVLFVGTSFSVGVTDLVAQYAAARRVPALSIDPGATRPPYRSIESVRAAAEVLLPVVVQQIRPER